MNKPYLTSILIVLSICCSLYNVNAQVVFLETFDEADNATTGTDNTAGAVGWTATCPGSIATTDFFKVLSGSLDAQDTNSPAAAWTTDAIDVSSCAAAGAIEVSVDVSESGNMEDCADCGGTGTICIDWVKIEYRLDGGAWTDFTGSTCALVESPGQLIYVGDMAGPETFTGIVCADGASDLELRISCMSWAASELWHFDNIQVACATDAACVVLPLELNYFEVAPKGTEVELQWETLSETNNDYFTIERSVDGIVWEELGQVQGAGISTEVEKYSIMDEKPYYGVSYYRLKQTDFDGTSTLSETRVITIAEKNNTAVRIYPNPTQQKLTIEGEPTELEEVRGFNTLGQEIVLKKQLQNDRKVVLDLSNLAAGIYYIKTKTTFNKVSKQ